MNKRLEEMTVEELKATAYDHLVMIQKSQESINILNQEINRRSQMPPKKEPLKSVLPPIPTIISPNTDNG